MLDTKHRIGQGRELAMPGDCVVVSDCHTGTVESFAATRTTQQWVVQLDDGRTVIVNDRAEIAISDWRGLPMKRVGDRWVLDTKTIELRRQRFDGCIGAGFRSAQR